MTKKRNVGKRFKEACKKTGQALNKLEYDEREK